MCARPSRSSSTLHAGLLLLAMGTVGCERTATAPAEQPAEKVTAATPAPRTPLELVVVDDEDVAITARREWTARTGQPLEVTTLDHNKVIQQLRRGESLDGDVIYFPGWMLGELAARNQLRELPTFAKRQGFADGDLALTEFWPLVKRRGMKWGDVDLAIASSERPLLLGYRADLLQHLELPPPESWPDLHELLQRISETEEAKRFDDWPALPFAQPNDSTSAAFGFLARGITYAKQRSRYSLLFDLATMRPQINRPEFVRALDELRADAQFADPTLTLDPAAAFVELFSGRCAVALGWAPRDPPADIRSGIAFAMLPGATERWAPPDGWEPRERTQRLALLGANSRYVGVLRRTRKQRTAWNLAIRLVGREWGGLVTAASTTASPTRPQTLDTLTSGLTGAELASYVAAYNDTMSLEDAGLVPRIPGADRYLDELARTMQQALTTETDSQVLLDALAKSWEEISAEQPELREAYYRSLGLEP